VKRVKEIIKDACVEMKLELYDIEYKKENATWVLRVMVDTDDGVTIDECVELNLLLNKRITDDLIENSYNLEVTSPGAERKLRNLDEIRKSIGKYVYVKTFQKISGQKEFYGNLVDFKDNLVYLDEHTINYDEVATIRLAIK